MVSVRQREPRDVLELPYGGRIAAWSCRRHQQYGRREDAAQIVLVSEKGEEQCVYTTRYKSQRRESELEYDDRADPRPRQGGVGF